jgi:hypothetical protein
MMQAQLLPIALNPRDVVYTPDDVARDVVQFFKPTGRILEPSAGDGAFLRYLPPDTDWCEIEKGRDFFACHEHYDWIIGNPPFSIFFDWVSHSFEIADNVVYLIPLSKVYSSWRMAELIRDYGGVRSVFMLGTGRVINFEVGFTVAAVHFR